ncbi:hypothetical protein PENSPDRAFT_759197 [Peniophora sp. CONT]|nr:hypothetical protein PENSPDRAFT_759197 [Peniophora sp. CONT]
MDPKDSQDRKTENAVVKLSPPVPNAPIILSPAAFNLSIFARARNRVYLKVGFRRAAQTGWNGTKLLLGVLKDSSDVFPPLKATVGGLVALIDIYERTKSNESGMAGTSQHIDRLLGLLAHRLEGNRETVSSFVHKPYTMVLAGHLEKLDEMMSQGKLRRIANSSQQEGDIKNICLEIERTLQELQLNIGLSLERLTETILQEAVLQNLKRAEAAAYTAAVPGAVSRRSCTRGTRDAVITEILAWALDEGPNAAPVYWMSGLAGQGKTTIAHTICERLDAAAGRPSVVSFFCSRQLDTKQEKLLVSTLAFRLAEASVSYASELLRALQKHRDLGDQKLDVQMSQLLVGPWTRSVDDRRGLRPIVVVVDALDENEAGTQFVELILAASREGKGLPGLRIFITSRPEPGIVHLCDPIGERTICRLNEVPRYLVHNDILQYLHEELPDHRGQHYLVDVANASAGLFVYASTIVRAVKARRVRRTKSEEESALRRLADRVSAEKPRGNSQITILDDLYEVIVADAFSELSCDEKDARERVLLTVICSPSRPDVLPILALCADVEDQDLVSAAVESLHPVLYIEDGAVFWHHASFQDYVLKTYETVGRPIRARILRRCSSIWEELLDLAEAGGVTMPEVEMQTLRARQAKYLARLENDDPDWNTACQHVYDALRLTVSMFEVGELHGEGETEGRLSDMEKVLRNTRIMSTNSTEHRQRGDATQYGTRRFSVGEDVLETA